jgi:hypothetical protein
MIEAAANAVGEAVAEVAVVAVQSIAAVRIAVIGKIILARQGTAVSRIVHSPRRAGVGIGLRRRWLRTGKCRHRQPNAASQQDRFG